MKKLVVILLLLATSCSAQLVFGGKVVSPYVKHFQGQMECAFVEGWFSRRKCMCHITDENFSQDKTFLAAEFIMCEKSF